MLTPVYYGEYKSSTSSTTGCVHKFMSLPSSEILFPAQVNYLCHLCSGIHAFSLVRTWNVSTKRQTEGFRSYCAFNAVELDVDIS